MIDYYEYLKSAEWQQVRTRLFKLRGRKCELCENTDSLHIHHLTYKRVGHERDEDLQILCDDCHVGITLNQYDDKKRSQRMREDDIDSGLHITENWKLEQ